MSVTEQNFEAMRSAMVASQLRTIGVTDPAIVDALSVVARERFVPEERKALAYVEMQLPLGGGRALNAPAATGRLLSQAKIKPTDHVLLIGAATGYTAAVVARLAGRVTAVESDHALIETARTQCADLANVAFVEGALNAGCAQHAPYDVVFVDGSIAAPGAALIEQLSENGVLVCGIDSPGTSQLSHGTKVAGQVRLAPFGEMECVNLPGFEVLAGFVF